MNGSFYQIGGSEIYALAINEGKELVKNSYVSNYEGLKRGTIWYNGRGCHIDKIYNAKEEIKSKIQWAISGLELYPDYNPTEEGFTGAYSDVLRKTNHTAIGFKDNKVYLITGKDYYLKTFKDIILNSPIAFDGLIALDGGGSTQMTYKNDHIVSSNRTLNHAITLKEV
ncbi:phosphodiester glycosidase family protein [Peptoniphilus catoniae]|uniref:phosphodiester glycosidase family protein n=1 Tax=Peptoniphilus catoniae TaxID=1660341 RepID=UPI003D1602CC